MRVKKFRLKEQNICIWYKKNALKSMIIKNILDLSNNYLPFGLVDIKGSTLILSGFAIPFGKVAKICIKGLSLIMYESLAL